MNNLKLNSRFNTMYLCMVALALLLMACTTGKQYTDTAEADNANTSRTVPATSKARLQCVKISSRKFYLAPFLPPDSLGGDTTSLATCQQQIESANHAQNIVCAIYRGKFFPTYFEVDAGKQLHQTPIGEGLSLLNCQSITTAAVDGFTCAKSNRKFQIHTIDLNPRPIDAGSRTLQTCLEKLGQ